MKIAAFLTATLIGLSAVAQPKIVAHRGHWRTAGSAQNSIASWHKADSVGVYGAEMDVWMNADGGLVVNHDQTFKGVNMVNAKFAESTAVILDNGENLPSLDKYLATVAATPGNTRLVLEMKSLPTLEREDIALPKSSMHSNITVCSTAPTSLLSQSMHVWNLRSSCLPMFLYTILMEILLLKS